MKDLQHNNAKHALDFHRVNAAAIFAFVILDVKQPPPILFLTDPKAYIASVNNAGATAMLTYLVHAAVPVLTFQRATRGADGATITKCLAFAFHAFQSLSHKLKSVYITMTALVGLTMAHPKLAKLLETACTFSLLGRIWVAFDRYLEYLNLLQQQRYDSPWARCACESASVRRAAHCLCALEPARGH